MTDSKLTKLASPTNDDTATKINDSPTKHDHSSDAKQASGESRQATTLDLSSDAKQVSGESRQATTLLAPTEIMTRWGPLEVSVHRCPKQIRRDCQLVFTSTLSKYSPTEKKQFMERLLIVPTTQHASLDLSNYGDAVAEEKDRLLENFMDWSEEVTSRLIELGYWAEYCDPCSGLPMHSPGNVVYAEVQGLCLLRGYSTMNVGTCKVVLHPSWGASVYPASMFTDAPFHVLTKVMSETVSKSNTSEEKSAESELDLLVETLKL